MVVENKVNVKDHVMLRMCTKRTIQDHIASKPDVLQHSETKLGSTNLLNEAEDKDFLFKLGIAAAHFGSLRRMKTLAVQIKNMKTGKELVKIECPCATKRRETGHSFARPDLVSSST